MFDKKISIIIPVYNREKYIDRCIKSVLEQENVNTEIILIDDGSTDNSPEMCDKYSREHDNIKVIHTKNCGVSHARNCGLDNATGDFLYFLDSDDRVAPGALSVLQKKIEETGADYIIGTFEEFSDSGEHKYKANISDRYLNRSLNKSDVLDIMSNEDRRLVMQVTAKLFRSSLWADIRFREDLRIAEDDAMIPVILDRAKSIYAINDKVYYTTASEVSLIRSEPTMKLLDATRVNLNIMEYCLSLDNYNAALFRFGHGTRKFINARKSLHSLEAKKEIRKQYKQYCDISKRIANKVGVRDKARFILFRLNLDLYDVVRKIAS